MYVIEQFANFDTDLQSQMLTPFSVDCLGVMCENWGPDVFTLPSQGRETQESTDQFHIWFLDTVQQAQVNITLTRVRELETI